MRKSDALAISKWVKVLAAGHWAERSHRCVVIKKYSCSSSSNNNNNMNKNRNKKKKKKKKKKKTNEHKNATKRCVARWLQAAVWKEHHTVLCTCAHVQSTWTTLFHFCPYPSLRFYDHNSGDQAMISAGTARWFCKRKWNRDCHITIQNQTPITLASGGLDTWFRKGNCQGIIGGHKHWEFTSLNARQSTGIWSDRGEFSATLRPPALSKHGRWMTQWLPSSCCLFGFQPSTPSSVVIIFALSIPFHPKIIYLSTVHIHMYIVLESKHLQEIAGVSKWCDGADTWLCHAHV